MSKKLSEFSWREMKGFILTVKSQLALITNDEDLREILNAFKDVKNNKETDKTYLDAVYALVDCLLVANESAFETIIAACLQTTPEKLQEINNIEIIETVTDFLSIDTYRTLLSRGITSALRGV